MTHQGKSVFVTGAGGFIGSHLTEGLVREGYNVKALVHYNASNSWGWLETLSDEIKNQVDVVAGDVCDPYAMKSAMKGSDIVFHLAALIAIPYSYFSPGSYVQTNVTGTLNMLQAARELEVERFVHTSTSEVYGTAQFVPITEEHPLQGQSPYSATKIAADQLAYSYYASFQLPVTIVRPFNTYGPRQSARAVIPTIITQLHRYSTIKLGVLHPTRDFNYVGDTVRGFIKAGQAERNAIGETLNLGSNYEISIGELAKLIADIMDKDVDIESDKERLRPRKSEVERLWAENKKAKQFLDWEPHFGGVEGLRKGLLRTIEWFMDQNNSKLYKAGNYTI